MSRPLVLGGSAGEHIAVKLTPLLNAELGEIEVKRFPDGETYIRILPDVKGRDVIYVNSLQRGPNDLVIETLFTVATLKELGAKKVVAVIPYMSYARQDERFNPGEVVSIEVLGRLFRTVEPDMIYTIDMHLHRIGDPSKVFGPNIRNLTAVRELGKYIKKFHDISNSVVIGPDEESEQWARVMADELGGVEYAILEKKRLTAEEVVIEVRGGLNVEGKDVVIVDDIISTGGTMVEAIKALRKLGVRSIIIAATHMLLVGKALPRILRLLPKDIVGTDTVLSPLSKVSVAPVIAEALRRDLGL